MPTAASAPPFFDVITTAYRDAVAAWRRLPMQSAVACSIFFVEMVLKMAGGLGGDKLAGGDIVLSAVLMLALIPYELALYRAYILGEPAHGYAFDFSPRFRRFLLWTVIVSIPIFVLNVWPLAAPSEGDDPGTGFVRAIFFLAMFAGMIVLLIGSALLFPAIAVDAPGATLANALADIRKHVLSVIAVLVAAFAPLVALPLMASMLSSAFGETSLDESVLYKLLEVLSGVLSATVYVVGMARLYEVFADRLKGGAAPVVSLAGD